jgi:hypothetical protein
MSKSEGFSMRPTKVVDGDRESSGIFSARVDISIGDLVDEGGKIKRGF